MKTKRTELQNVSNNERGFRVVIALGMLSGVIAGTVSAPVTMFALAMVSIYLVTTAIIGSDPVYALAQSLPIEKISHNGRSLAA